MVAVYPIRGYYSIVIVELDNDEIDRLSSTLISSLCSSTGGFTGARKIYGLTSSGSDSPP